LAENRTADCRLIRALPTESFLEIVPLRLVQAVARLAINALLGAHRRFVGRFKINGSAALQGCPRRHEQA